MNQHVRRAVPYAAAWLAPGLVLGLVLLATGQNPAQGLAYGWTGALGAAVYTVTRSWLHYRTALALLRELEPVRHEN